MKYAIIDTETSGMFDWKKPADAPGQPRLAALHMILVERHENHLIDIQADEFFVWPDGWEVSAEASAVNGLTTEHLAQIGEPVAVALEGYCNVVDQGYVIVAFNAQYDTKVMRGELRLAGIDDRFEKTPNICCMRAAMSHGVKNSKGKGGSPSLADTCAHFGIEHQGQHTAGGDARACLEVLRKLIQVGACPEPAVKYAKTERQS